MNQAGLEQALWALGRGAGVTALVLMTISVITGILTRSGRPLIALPRFGVTELHRTTALLGTGLIGLHILTLLADPYAQLRPARRANPSVTRTRSCCSTLRTWSWTVSLRLPPPSAPGKATSTRGRRRCPQSGTPCRNAKQPVGAAQPCI